MVVGLISLGCAKNVVDSERMLAEIAQAGYLLSSEPAEADVVVVNTCGFIEPAICEALETIKEVAGYKSKGKVKKLIVAGCLSERFGRSLFDRAEGIDAVVGLGQRDNIADIVKKTMVSGQREAYMEPSGRLVSDDRVRLRIGPNHWSYLRISQGCDHRCSFCTIPAIRGRFRSKPLSLVLPEANELVSAGAVELNIIGQDTTCYGRDINITDGLTKLLSKLAEIPDLGWIRLLYLYPQGITDTLIELLAGSEKIVHYMDIPVQHINNEILKSMRRSDTSESICRLIERLRKAMPDIVLRTTLIAGFPGESGRQFEQLVDFVKWARFDALGCFKFYPESGTIAAEMPGQVSNDVKQQRLEEVMLTQQEIAFSKNKARVGSRLRCLVDSVDIYCGIGRFYGQAPEIDSISIIRNCSAKAGDFIDVEVTGTEDYDLVVRQIRS